MRTYRTTSKFTTATRNGYCHFCTKLIETGDNMWWYPNSRRAFHTQCKGLSKNAQKGVTVRKMTEEELETFKARASRGQTA